MEKERRMKRPARTGCDLGRDKCAGRPARDLNGGAQHSGRMARKAWAAHPVAGDRDRQDDAEWITGWENLANAIVEQAVKDYRAVLCILKETDTQRGRTARASIGRNRRRNGGEAAKANPEAAERQDEETDEDTVSARNIRRRAARARKAEVERFFHSAWFGTITKIDPDWLIQCIRKETDG